MTARALVGAASRSPSRALTARPAAAQVPDPAPPADAPADAGLPDGPPASTSASPARARARRRAAAAAATELHRPDRSRAAAASWSGGDRGAEPSSPWDRTTAETMSARWRSNLYGFVELDAMHDSTQSYGPSSNNAMLARPGTYAGLHGRTQFTANNSLFGFMLKAPDWGRLHTFGHVEVDFFGVQPTDATEQQVYTAPSVRMRLFYFRLRQDFFTRASVDLLVGQYHDLFAWGGAGFYPHSIAFLGIAGEVYHRNPQIRGTLSIPLCCVTPRHRRRRRAPGAARQRGARRAGRREAQPGPVAGRRRAGLRPARHPAAVDRRVGHLAPVRGGGVPARPRRAEDRVRLGSGRRRVRPRSSRRARRSTARTRCR